MLDIEKLYKSDAATVDIIHPAGSLTATGRKISRHLVENDLVLGISSMFSDSDDGSTGMAQDTYNIAANIAGGAHRVIKSVQQTVSQWNGSTKPSFELSTTLVNYSKNKSIIDEVKSFYAGVTPNFRGATIVAPYKYSTPYTSGTSKFLTDTYGALHTDELYLGFRKGIEGTWAIRYSLWLQITKLVLTSCVCTFSKETARGTNEPLYARLSLIFQPAILPSNLEVQGWFKSGRYSQLTQDEIAAAVQENFDYVNSPMRQIPTGG